MKIYKSTIMIGVITLIIFVLFTKTQVKASSLACVSNSCFATDSVTFSDKTFLLNIFLRAFDRITVSDTPVPIVNFITSLVTSTTTSVITQIGKACGGLIASCYINPNAGTLEAIIENVGFPAIFVVGTVFGFIYMGVKYFTVSIMVAAFIILGLAYVGILPSYFTLLTILGVSAALTRVVGGMIFSSGSE